MKVDVVRLKTLIKKTANKMSGVHGLSIVTATHRLCVAPSTANMAAAIAWLRIDYESVSLN